MHRFLVAAASAAGVLITSCTGSQTGSMIPSGGAAGPASRSAAPALSLPAPRGWTATGTGALRPLHVQGIAHAAPAQPVTVHVGLALRNVRELQSLIASRQVIAEAEFVHRFGPDPADVANVEKYLRAQGFSNVHHDPNFLLVHGTARAENVERAFSTRLETFTGQGRRYYANVEPARVPEALKNVVAVLGLNNLKAVKAPHENGELLQKKSYATPSPSPSSQPCTENAQGLCVRFYDPPSFQNVYDAAKAPTALNTAVAIVTEGQLTTAISDFRTNESAFKMAQVPVSIVQAEPPSTDTAGNDEWTLDMTYSSGMAAKVKQLLLYNMAALGDSDIVNAYNRWVTDDKAPVGNSSFGGCEVFPYTDGAMVMADEVLVQAAAQGQTMFVSTGDNGGYCNNFVDTNGAPGGAPMAEWPSVSPYVVAVGGTDLFSNPDGTYLGETAWEAGGGGLSQFEYGPNWEAGVQPVNSTGVATFRGVPDVAMDASLETGALLYTSSQAVNGSCTPCTTGGTSLASPLAAGSYARMQSAHGNKLGFGALAFYNAYKANPNATETSGGPPPTQLVGGYHDILAGTNGLYTAGPGFDYTTGMGSLDVVKLNALIGH